MAFEEPLKQLKERTERALAMGGPEKLAKRKAEGLLNARERIDYLIDKDSFFESGRFAVGIRPEVKSKTPADGKVAGFARIDGREVALVSNDFTVLGASSSVINMKKIKHMKQVACKRGLPLVMLGESSGARMPDRMGSAGRAIIAQDPTEYQRLRETPWASALLGACYGSSTWYSAMSDFVVMRKGAIMAIASPGVTSIAINKPITPEELGGWKLLTGISGLVDLAVDTDQQAIDKFADGYYLSDSIFTPQILKKAGGGSGLQNLASFIQDLKALIDRIANDEGSDSAVIDQHIIESAGDLFDRRADDIFYFNKGRLYANFILLRELGADFEGVIRERNLGNAWNGMVETFRLASALQPWIVWNGYPDGLFIPNHLAAQGFYLLRARVQLREISGILLK